jgi:hypothetical protein
LEKTPAAFVQHRSGGFTGVPEDFFVAQACLPCLPQAGAGRFEEIFDGRFEHGSDLVGVNSKPTL